MVAQKHNVLISGAVPGATDSVSETFVFENGRDCLRCRCRVRQYSLTYHGKEVLVTNEAQNDPIIEEMDNADCVARELVKKACIV